MEIGHGNPREFHGIIEKGKKYFLYVALIFSAEVSSRGFYLPYYPLPGNFPNSSLPQLQPQGTLYLGPVGHFRACTFTSINVLGLSP